jgi:hypothetical protein
MIEIFLFIFIWLIGTIICTVFLVRCIRFGRKFGREIKERYPEVLAQRKKYFLWPTTSPFVTFVIPDENDMLDEETIALKKKACYSFVGIFLSFGLLLIFSFLLQLIFG